MKLEVPQSLKNHRLWSGSMLKYMDENGFLGINAVQDKITMLKRCDDLTPLEKSYLAELEKFASL